MPSAWFVCFETDRAAALTIFLDLQGARYPTGNTLNTINQARCPVPLNLTAQLGIGANIAGKILQAMQEASLAP